MPVVFDNIWKECKKLAGAQCNNFCEEYVSSQRKEDSNESELRKAAAHLLYSTLNESAGVMCASSPLHQGLVWYLLSAVIADTEHM